MDEMDIIQEAAVAAQEAILEKRRRQMQAAASVKPPESLECAECGTDIPKQRLAANPLATLCVDCQADLERPRRL